MSRPAGVDPRITPPRSARPIEKTTHQAPLFSGLLGRVKQSALWAEDRDCRQMKVRTLSFVIIPYPIYLLVTIGSALILFDIHLMGGSWSGAGTPPGASSSVEFQGERVDTLKQLTQQMLADVEPLNTASAMWIDLTPDIIGWVLIGVGAYRLRGLGVPAKIALGAASGGALCECVNLFIFMWRDLPENAYVLYTFTSFASLIALPIVVIALWIHPTVQSHRLGQARF